MSYRVRRPPCHDLAVGLSADLADWTDWDVAQFALGRALGLFAGRPFLKVKSVFWTDNPLGNALYDMLQALVRAGILEHRDAPDDQFRWRADAPLAGLVGDEV